VTNPAADYEIIYLTAHGMIHKKHSGAPSEQWLISTGKRSRAQFVIRYFPSRKGWRILDVRNVSEHAFTGSRRLTWSGQVRGDRYWPNKDAAIMYALHKLS
jgi:hypothetical protein